MKKIIKYMLFILTIFLINISNINAEEYKGVIEKGETIEGIYYYKTREDNEGITYPTHSFHEQAHIYYDSINHNVVYCIESWEPTTGATTNDYSVFDRNVENTNLTSSQIDKINLIAYYGYGYKDEEHDHTSPKWYAITQMLIWQLQAPEYKHYIVDSITSTKPSYMYYDQMEEIEELIDNYKEYPNIFNTEMTINTKKEDRDASGNLKYYEIDSCDDGIELTIEDNKTIIKSLNKAGEFSYVLRRKSNKWNKKMKIYVSDKFQNFFEPGDMKDRLFSRIVTVKDYKLDFSINSVVPNRLNEDGEKTYVTRFFPNIEIALKVKKDIYDGAGNLVYKKNSIYSKVKSVEDYSSISVPPGTFELKVIKDIPGFKSEPKIVEIKDSNVKSDIILQRSVFNINVYKTLEKMQDNGSITKEPGKSISFGLYAGDDIKNLSGKIFIKKDRLIETLETNELGKISHNDAFLLPGKYYLKELTELDNYESNDQKYEINLVYPTEYKDYIKTKEILVENKLKTGKLTIKKLDADEYFPLENVTYSLYSKDNSLIATKSTNSYGEVDFDVKIGEYYIKENTALDGYIRDDKIYYVKVDYTNLNPSYKLLNEKIIKEDKIPDEEDNSKEETEKTDEENNSKEEVEKPVEQPVEQPENPKEEPEKPSTPPVDSKEDSKLSTEQLDNPKDQVIPNKELEDKSEQEKIVEENNQELDKEEELIVNVPSTNVYDYSFVLLFLLSITFISIRKCLKG